MTEKRHTIEISAELNDAIQQLKQIFTEMSGKPITSDEDVLSVLVSGFIDSVMHDQENGGMDDEDEDAEAAHDAKHGGHKHEGHDHGHHDHHAHNHGKDGCCGGKGENCACEPGEEKKGE